MRIKALLLAALFATGAVLSACGGGEEAGDAEGDATMEQPANETTPAASETTNDDATSGDAHGMDNDSTTTDDTTHGGGM